LSSTSSSQRDSRFSNPPSPSMSSSRDMSTGPSLSLRMMPRLRRMMRAHMRKVRRRNRKVERTIRRGRRTRRASGGPWGWFGCLDMRGGRQARAVTLSLRLPNADYHILQSKCHQRSPPPSPQRPDESRPHAGEPHPMSQTPPTIQLWPRFARFSEVTHPTMPFLSRFGLLCSTQSSM